MELDRTFSHLRPYDSSLEEKNTMYDKLAYKKDPDLCNTEKVRLVSGNVFKSYSIDYQSAAPYQVDTKDELTKRRLEQMQQDIDAMNLEDSIQAEESEAALAEDTEEQIG